MSAGVPEDPAWESALEKSWRWVGGGRREWWFPQVWLHLPAEHRAHFDTLVTCLFSLQTLSPLEARNVLIIFVFRESSLEPGT